MINGLHEAESIIGCKTGTPLSLLSTVSSAFIAPSAVSSHSVSCG